MWRGQVLYVYLKAERHVLLQGAGVSWLGDRNGCFFVLGHTKLICHAAVSIVIYFLIEHFFPLTFPFDVKKIKMEYDENKHLEKSS